jgi:hypothetical protein
MQLSVNRSFSKVLGSFAIYASHTVTQAERLAFALAVGSVFFATGAVTAVAQASSGAQVAAEFRTAPRSLITEKVDRTRTLQIPGASNPIVGKYADLGEVDGATPIQHIQLLLRRPAERQAAFDAQLEALHTKGSPSYHKWLTPDVVGTEFGPSAADIQTVALFLQSYGFSVDHVGKSGLYIDFTGTASQVEYAFQTKLHRFELEDESGEVKYSAIQPASIPEALTPSVVGLVGLSNISSLHTNYHRVQRHVSGTNLSTNTNEPAAQPEDTVSTTNYAVGPQDFYTIYNENSLLSSNINGSGVTIALLEESAINTADVTNFRKTYNVLPNTPVSLVVDTGYGTNTCTAPAKLAASGEEGEAILDVQWAGAVAPKANLLFMQCAAGAVLGVFYSAEAVIDNNLADVMSLSYGQYEGYSTTEDNLALDLWEQAASQGETVVVSAGDTGAAAEDGNYGTSYVQYGITASSFSTTAWNVSAGGTDFMDAYNDAEGDSAFGVSTYWSATNGTGLSSAKSYVPEMTWNDSCGSSIYANAFTINNVTATPESFCGLIGDKYKGVTYGALAGGGGAPSQLSTRPRPTWQTGTVYGLPPVSGSNAFRLQPDVSLFASNGFWEHDLPSYESDKGGTSYAGGTSFVAPQLAGIFALINQATSERQGQPNYVLYDMAGIEFGTSTPVPNSCNGGGASGVGTTASSPSSSCIFYDIQSGSTQLPCVKGDANCYTAAGQGYTHGVLSTSTTADNPAFATGVGWDDATGIGSLNIANLVSNWQNTTTSVLFSPVIALTPATTTYTYGAPPALSYTTQVTGSGSLPTGSVSLSGSPIIGAIGSAVALVPTAACKTGGAVGTTSGTCYEAATQAYTPSATTVSAGTYTITATYNPTNENYLSGTGTASIVVNQQTPGFSFTAPTGTVAYGTANVVITAKLTYTGTGLVPVTANLVSFQISGFGTFTATCTGTASPLTCSYTLPLAGASSGVYPISATYVGDTNYAGATATGTLTYGNASTIGGFTVGNPQHTMYPSVTLTVASNSNGALAYSVTSGPATYQGLVGGKPNFLLTGAGTVVLKASQAAATGAQTYTPTYVTTTFTVLAGSIWIGDNSNYVSTFDLLGNPISGSGASGLTGAGIVAIASPTGEAFDASGYLWVASSAGVSEFTFPNPTAVSATPNTSGGISSPVALTIDGTSQIWVANNNGTVSALSNAGVALSPSTGYTYSAVSSSSGGVSVDLSGNLWVTNSADNSVTKIVGVAEPIAPPSTALSNGTTGQLP